MTADLEQTLIGTLLLRQDAVYDLPASFRPEVFTGRSARQAFEAIDRLAKKKRPIEIPLVVADGKLDEDAAVWLREAATIGTLNSPRGYAEEILKAHRSRALATALQDAQMQLRDHDAETVAAGLVTRLLDVGRSDPPETVTYRDAAIAALEQIAAEKSGKGAVVKTGFAAVDGALSIRKGNLVVLAARPAVGKSTLALNIAENVATGGGHVLVHSLEMADVELVGRMWSRATKIFANRIFDGEQIDPWQWDAIGAAIDAKAKVPLHLNTHRFGLGEIVRITERLHRKHGLALVVVDYLQLIDVDLGKGANDEQRIGTASRTLKLLAQRLEVPILAVAQLNREIEKRATAGKTETGVPRLADLRGSGRIEQDANSVLFLHQPKPDREEYELVIAKQRTGKKHVTVQLIGDLGHAQFREGIWKT